MEISVSNPSLYFKLFYLLAFAFIFTMIFYKSIKRGYHLRSVLLMLTTISLLTIIGTRLFTIPIGDWASLINVESSMFNNRSAIGGLLFGLVGLLISQKVFGFNRPILDLYAWIVPIALGIQKMGCFFNGCCYGSYSNGFWGVQYPQGTHAHFNQWASGLIANDATMSLSLYPVQLYETLFLFIISIVVWKTHKLWKRNASALFFSLFLFFMFRFGIEFMRDPAGSQFNVNYLFGIRVFQWIILVLGLLFGLMLLFYEKYLKTDLIKGRQNSLYIHIDLIYILTISVIVFVCTGLFSKYELVALWLSFIPAILLTLYYLITDYQVKFYRILTSILILIPFYVISQTVQKDSTKIEKYKRLDIGGSFGSFYNEVSYNPQQGECGTSYTTEYYKHVYSIGGLGFSQIIKNNTTTKYGVNVHAGTIKSTNLTTNTENSEFMFAANPYIKFDGKWFGGGFGLQVGTLRKNKDERIDETNIEDAQKAYNFFPELYFRVGRPEYLDIDFKHGFLFPSPYPTLYQRISIGSGFGKSSDYSLRYGKILPIDASFISAEGLFSDQFGANVMYIFNENSSVPSQNTSGKIIFGINYRFDFKRE